MRLETLWIAEQPTDHSPLFSLLISDPKAAAPRPPTLSSVPALLTSLQNEYDAILLETFNVKKQYENVRQELAHALYANDAANRVVARLIYERDQAREALASIQSSLGGGIADAPVASTSAVPDGPAAADTEMAEAPSAATQLPPAIDAKIDVTAERLSAQRRAKMKRKAVPEGYATAADMEALGQKSSTSSLHSTKPPGVTALSVSPNGKLALTGGNDKQLHVYDRSTGKSVATLKGHTKKIVQVAFSPDGAEILTGSEAEGHPSPRYAVSAAEDSTIRIWTLDAGSDGSYSSSHVIKTDRADLTGISIHPSGDLVASCFRDGTWLVHDLSTAELLLTVPPPSDESAEDAAGGHSYESIQFHPDGKLIAMGTSEGVVRVWDTKAAAKVASFRGEEHQGKAVHSIDFSENGYYLAVAAKTSSHVGIWDLRKLSQAGSIALPADAASEEGAAVVKFDPSAAYLAVAGSDVRLYANKTWKELKVCEEGIAGQITALAWDARNGDLVTVGLDRTMRVFGKAAS